MCQAAIRLANTEYLKHLTNTNSPYKRRVKDLRGIKAIIALEHTLSLKIFELLGCFCPESDFCIVFLTFLDIFSPRVEVEAHMWRSEIHTMCHLLNPPTAGSSLNKLGTHHLGSTARSMHSRTSWPRLPVLEVEPPLTRLLELLGIQTWVLMSAASTSCAEQISHDPVVVWGNLNVNKAPPLL